MYIYIVLTAERAYVTRTEEASSGMKEKEDGNLR